MSFKTLSNRRAVHVDRFHLLHQFPQLEHFLAQQALDAAQFAAHHGWRGLGLTPQNVHLHLDRNQRLHRAIVQFPRKARALRRSRPASQPVQQINVVNRRPHLANQIEQKTQFLLRLPPPRRVQKEYPSSPFASEEKDTAISERKGCRSLQFGPALRCSATAPGCPRRSSASIDQRSPS